MLPNKMPKWLKESKMVRLKCKRIAEWFFSLFVSKEAIANLKQEALADSKKAIIEFQNKKYMAKLKRK